MPPFREHIRYKSRKEIEKLREAGRLAANALRVAARAAKPGVSLLDVDKVAERYIRAQGGTPNFKGYHGFPGTLCLSVNDRVVHGIPDRYVLQEGDVLAIDCGAKLDGFHGDTCLTVGVGRISEEAKRLLGEKDRKIADIADEVGYHSPYYFSRAFKKETGQSPKAYRAGL